MNPQIPIETRQTVLDFVTAVTSFTAYEVTLEVRRRLGTSIDVPHSAVNGIVQTMFARGEIIGYDRRSDQTVAAATPPLRYYQIGGAVAAPFVAPTTPAISRSNLPPALRFSNPFRALMCNLGIAARDFGRANGKVDEPFAVWLPTPKEPTFRLRCYGTGWNQSEIEQRFALDLNNAGDADLRWLAPLAYADEFRLYSNVSGTQTQFLIRINAALQTTATQEAERVIGEPDGLQIEVAVRNHDVYLGERALQIYRYLRVAPRIYRAGQTLTIVPPKMISQGSNWKLTDNKEPLAIVDEVAYSLFGLDVVADLGVELYLDAADVEPSLERLVQTDRTRTERARVLENFKREVVAPIQQRIESAANLWEAKITWRELFGNAGGNARAIQNLVGNAVSWRGIAIEGADFHWHRALQGVKVRQYLPSNSDKTLDSMAVYSLGAHPETLVFINDVGFEKSPTSRLKELYRTAPFKTAYVLSFEDEAARVQFFRETHFDSVPTRPISQLPKPARALSTPRPTNRKAFDAQLHQVQAPHSAVAASFAAGDGSDDDFDNLKVWAQTAPLDEKNWPDFKRLYKAIEARVWPPLGRFRWDKSETDFTATPMPSARELELLGVLMGRLDEINALRGHNQTPVAPHPTIAQRALHAIGNLIGRADAATASGPSHNTLAYMKRRATKLLKFLRDTTGLSAQRRSALAPLVCGLLQRQSCAYIQATLPLRLKLGETDVLAQHPDAIARVWAEANLPLSIARWSYNWLEEHGQTVAVSPAQLRRFVETGDAEMTFKLASAALQSSENWPRDFTIKKFGRILQGTFPKHAAISTAFLTQRNEVLDLFARFAQLTVDESWLRASLGQSNDAVTLDWLAPWLHGWAQSGEFALLQQMSPALQSRFNAAIVAAHPHGFSLEKWRQISAAPILIEQLAPALRELPISSEIVDFIWALPPSQRAPIISALEDNPALSPIIEARARQLDWTFAAPLSTSQWQRFARDVAASHSAGVSAANWAKIAELPFEAGFDTLPLGAGFWEFALPLENSLRAQWIERVGAGRAGVEFANQSAVVFEQLLDSGAMGLDTLGDAWLDAHLHQVPLDGELIIKLAQSHVADWPARALARLQSAELRLPVALRLMESELPILERVAAPFFFDENPDWSERVLALADSPKMVARRLALQLLEEFPRRWTPGLLRNLAQHDDAGIQAFVAAQLENAPAEVAKSKAVEAFDNAIINARGRARRAKNSVQTRLTKDGEFDRATLLDAARNGAPRDREWALKQLVLASLAGESVEGLEVEGAFAKADSV